MKGPKRMNNKNTKSTPFRLNNVSVVWANLHEPDDFRGQKKHDISVTLDPAVVDEMREAVGGSGDIKGIRIGDKGDTIAKAKTTIFVKKGETKFPKVFDSTPKIVNTRVGHGDIVNLDISIYEYDTNLFTLMLNSVQIVQKNPEFGGDGHGTGGFGAIEDGYQGSSAAVAETATTDGGWPATANLPEVSGDGSADLPF